jgi:hypothetical protein
MKKIYWRIVYDQRSDVAAYVCVKCGFQGPQVWQGKPKSAHRCKPPVALAGEK